MPVQADDEEEEDDDVEESKDESEAKEDTSIDIQIEETKLEETTKSLADKMFRKQLEKYKERFRIKKKKSSSYSAL